MAIARGTGPTNGSSLTTTGSSTNITAPTSWASGLFAVLAICPYDNALTTPPTITAAGWTLAGNAVDSTYGRISLYGRFWAAGETSATTWAISFDRASVWSWACVPYSGVDTTTPFSAASSPTVTSTTAPFTATVTPTDVNQWLLSYFSDRTTTSSAKTTAWTPAAPLVNEVEVNNNTKASAPWCTTDFCDDNAAVGSLAATSRHSTRTGPAANVIWNSLAVFLNPVAAGQPAPAAYGVRPRLAPKEAAVR